MLNYSLNETFTRFCVLQAAVGQGEARSGVLQLLPLRHLHPQTPCNMSGAAHQERDGPRNCSTCPNHNRRDTHCHQPASTPTGAFSTPAATPSASCTASAAAPPSTFSSSITSCPGLPSAPACGPHHPAQPSPVVGRLLGRRCVLSDWSFQALQALQPLEPIESHPVWTLVSLTSDANHDWSCQRLRRHTMYCLHARYRQIFEVQILAGLSKTSSDFWTELISTLSFNKYQTLCQTSARKLQFERNIQTVIMFSSTVELGYLLIQPGGSTMWRTHSGNVFPWNLSGGKRKKAELEDSLLFVCSVLHNLINARPSEPWDHLHSFVVQIYISEYKNIYCK